MPPNYLASFDQYVAKAQDYAQRGEILGMLIALDTAKICAKQCNLDFTTWQREIQNLGYSTALPLLLQQAKQSALEGKIKDLEFSLKDAKEYAAQIGQDISIEIREINQMTYN